VTGVTVRSTLCSAGVMAITKWSISEFSDSELGGDFLFQQMVTDQGAPDTDQSAWLTRDQFYDLLFLGMSALRPFRNNCGNNWSQSKLAERAGLSLPTVKRVEIDLGLRVSEEARNKLRRASESAGVEFIDENGGGPGVRLRKRHQKKS